MKFLDFCKHLLAPATLFLRTPSIGFGLRSTAQIETAEVYTGLHSGTASLELASVQALNCLLSLGKPAQFV